MSGSHVLLVSGSNKLVLHSAAVRAHSMRMGEVISL
jgi:hypothetical protein